MRVAQTPTTRKVYAMWAPIRREGMTTLARLIREQEELALADGRHTGPDGVIGAAQAAFAVPTRPAPQGPPPGARIVTRRGGDAACLMWGAWPHGVRHG